MPHLVVVYDDDDVLEGVEALIKRVFSFHSKLCSNFKCEMTIEGDDVELITKNC